MAETIHRYLLEHPGHLVVSYQGDFHSAFGLGIVTKLRMLNASLNCLVISTVPVEDPSSADWENYRGQGDYLMLVPASR